MKLKSLLAAAAIGLAGLTLSSCVEGGDPYGYGGYSGGYYGGTVIVGRGDYYRPGYRYDRYRYRGYHRRYHRPGRPYYSGRHSGYRRDGGYRGMRYRIPTGKNVRR